MSERSERIAAALEGVRAKFAAKDETISSLHLQLSDLSTLRERLEAKLAIQIWAELDSGKSVPVGTQVRYFGRVYECIEAHTKALLRSPINTQYWREVED